MCVIAIQNTNQPMLTRKEVFSMANKNPHGFGLMWTDGNKTYFRKGYFDAESYYKAYTAIYNDPKVKCIGLHFRIATGSNIDVANCHPFPITGNKKRIKSPNSTADCCVMMNGIIGDSTKELSDTALYVISNLKSYYDYDSRFWLHFDKRSEMLFENEINGTRWAFMSKEGFKLFGYGWTDYEGKCMVSNRYWIPYKPTPKPKSKNENRKSESNTLWNDKYRTNRFYTNSETQHKSYIDYLLDDCCVPFN